MDGVKSKLSAQWWWFDSQSNESPRKSPWLHSTLSELDEKTEAMLKLIEEDADSFAKRAEMYYKKRPELINIVEDLYRAHRSLAEKYDQVKFDSGNRHLITPWTSCPLPLSKFRTTQSIKDLDKSYDSCSESKFRTSQPIKDSEKSYDSYSESFDYDHDYYDSGESVVLDDLELEVDVQQKEETEELKLNLFDDEKTKLIEEIEKLRDENKIQKEQLIQKDEEKREAIRQLCISMDLLKQENTSLKSRIVKDYSKKQSSSNKSSSPFEFNKVKGAIWGMLFTGDDTTVVPL
uniref:Protein NETWORKED 3A-like n=1 Tax=Tanacetum cinerariifolium TaxID=118510 RepID=A0A6L2JV42_TANCI|nr:protein NETWORKED 3A-like [Tanacetum cinerariifolium]